MKASGIITAILGGLISLSSLAVVSNDQLTMRLEELKSISGLDREALQREASYELRGQGLDERAEIEAMRLVTTIREAVKRSLERAYQDSNNLTLAKQQVRAEAEKDLHLIDESLRNEIRQIVEDELNQDNKSSKLVTISETLHSKMRLRSQLQQELLLDTPTQIDEALDSKMNFVGYIRELSQERFGEVEHASKAALVQALVDDRSQSERWVSTANMSASSAIQKGYESEFSAQVSAEFLGVKVAAGPTFKFKKYVTTAVDVKGEGLYPLFDAQGRFDLELRDGNGEIRKVDGGHGRRFIFFTCEVQTEVESEVAAGGGFKVAGLGADGKVVAKYVNSVTSSSRRVLVPNTIDGRQAILSTLANLCHRDFMNAKTSNGRTVLQNIDTMVNNIAQGLTYVNPAMKCVTDNHCVNWYNREVIWLHKYYTSPRCIQDKTNSSLMTCQLRGVENAACSVYRDGERVSSGMFEYQCAQGYQCVVSHKGGWFQNWEIWDPWRAECRKKK